MNNMSSLTLSLSEAEKNVIKDSLSSEKLNVTEIKSSDPEIQEYLNLLESIERKLN